VSKGQYKALPSIKGWANLQFHHNATLATSCESLNKKFGLRNSLKWPSLIRKNSQ